MRRLTRYSGILLILVGELLAVLGFATYFFLNEVIDLDTSQMLNRVRWVIDHAREIADFLANVNTYEAYALAAGIVGALMLAGGLTLLLLRNSASGRW